MKKTLLFLVVMVLTIGQAQGQEPVRVAYVMLGKVSRPPFRIMRFKKGEYKGYKNDKGLSVVKFHGKNDESVSSIDAFRGTIKDAKKEGAQFIEIGDSRLKAIGDGWYEYDFGRTMEFIGIGGAVGNEEYGCYPIYIIPLSEEELEAEIEAEEEPAPKTIDYSHLENEGYTLTRSSVIDGIKCDHYEKGDSKLRVFRKKNGDYLVDLEDEFGFDRVPHNASWLAYSITLSDGFKISLNAGASLEEFPTGIRRSLGDAYNFKWQDFKEDCINKDRIRNNTISEKFDYILLPGDPKKYKSYEFKGHFSRERSDEGFYRINNYLYDLDEYGNLHRYAQKFGDYFYYVNSSDSIVDVIITETGQHDIKYANGDYLTIKNVSKRLFWQREKDAVVDAFIIEEYRDYDGGKLYGGDITGKIHRNGGLLEIKESGRVDDRDLILTLPDGSKCRIFSVVYPNNKIMADVHLPGEILVEDALELKDYVQYFPDGREIEYKNGVTVEELEARKKAREKAQEEELQAAIQALCDMYGEKFVVAAIVDGKPIIGMPEGLLRSAFRTELIRESGSSKCYRIIGSGLINGWGSITVSNNLTRCYVWVTAGRVSSITY